MRVDYRLARERGFVFRPSVRVVTDQGTPKINGKRPWLVCVLLGLWAEPGPGGRRLVGAGYIGGITVWAARLAVTRRKQDNYWNPEETPWSFGVEQHGNRVPYIKH